MTGHIYVLKNAICYYEPQDLTFEKSPFRPSWKGNLMSFRLVIL